MAAKALTVMLSSPPTPVPSPQTHQSSDALGHISACFFASIAFAAVLLIIPGFLTDLIGFILLIPFTRRILFRIIFKKKATTDNHKEKIDTIDGEIVKKEKDEL